MYLVSTEYYCSCYSFQLNIVNNFKENKITTLACDKLMCENNKLDSLFYIALIKKLNLFRI